MPRVKREPSAAAADARKEQNLAPEVQVRRYFTTTAFAPCCSPSLHLQSLLVGVSLCRTSLIGDVSVAPHSRGSKGSVDTGQGST